MKSSRFFVGFLVLLSLVSASAGTIVQFRTTLGDFDVELYDADKPVTVSNFLQYVQGGYYTNMFFHRVVPTFVIQGGGFLVTDRGTTNASIGSVTTFAPITNEFGIGKFYSNVYGTIAMAKTSDPNSATSQFFFNLADNSSSLDDTNNSGGFTVFGHVIAGTNVLNHFLVSQSNHLLQEVNAGGALAELPVLGGVANLTFDDLIYVDVHTAPHYVPLKANYNGLFAAPTDVSLAAGSITVTTTTGPKFTGSLRLGAARYGFSGAFDTNGFAVVTTGPSSHRMVLNLHPDAVLGTDKLVGSLSTATWVADVEGYRAGFDARVNPATAYAGKYTLTLPPSGQTNAPDGYGFAALSVNTAGSVVLKGSLADGSAFSQTVPLSRDGQFPLYAPLYGNAGYVSGWMAITNQPGAELTGSVLWFKSSGSKGLFPVGFTSTLAAAGGRYTVPAPGVNLLSATNSFVFGGDSSTMSFTNTLILKPGNKLFNTSANKLSISLSASTGLFTGSVKPPGSAHSIPFKGALWQNNGYGYFLDAGQTGPVLLQP